MIMPLFGPPDIAKLQSKQDFKGLAKALKYKKNAGTRLQAAIALQKVGDAKATQSLVTALKDEDKRVRKEAAIALGIIGETGAETTLIVPALLDCDVEDKVRLDALVRIGPASVEPLIQSIRDQQGSLPVAAEALGLIGDSRAVEALISLLKNKSSLTRRKASGALAKIHDPRAIHPLIEGLRFFEDKNYFRPAILTFEEKAEDPLIEALGHENKYIRAQAAEALGEIGSTKAAPALILLLNETTTIFPAMDALKNIGPMAVDPLIEALKDENNNTGTIAYLLGKIGDRRATLPLIEVTHHAGEKVRFEAVQALNWIGDQRAVPAMLDFLQSEQNGRTRKQASEFFSHTDKSVITTLIPMLENTSTQAHLAACIALQAMNWEHEGEDEQAIDEELVDSLYTLLQSPSLQVRDAARATLQTLKWEPGTDEEQMVSWLAHSEVYRFEDINLKKTFDLLKSAISWEMDWSAKGRLAQILLDSGITLDPEEILWAEAEVEQFYAKVIDLIPEMLEKPHSRTRMDENTGKNLFLDYARLVTRASLYNRSSGGGVETYYSYNKKPALEAIQELCRIDSPVSSNLLHHLSKLPDIQVERGIFEVEYDSEHPTGMGTSYMTLSFKDHRQTAEKELKRRGNPPYDPDYYRTRSNWLIK